MVRQGHPLSQGTLDLDADLNTPEEMNIRLYWHESTDADPDNQWLRDNLLSIFDTDSK